MKLLLLDLTAGAGTGRLRSALEQERYAVESTTDPVVAGVLAHDDAVATTLVCADRWGAAVEAWCVRLRAADAWVPVVVLLDDADPPDVVAALDAGADDCVTRPVRFSEIAARVRALVRRGVAHRPAVLVVGDLRLDPSSHRVWRGDDEITLTPREFALLHTLMHDAGRVLTRQALLESAWASTWGRWDGSPDPVSNVVDQYVGRLRRLLDAPYGRHDLQTVRGVGYRLRLPDDDAASSAQVAPSPSATARRASL